MQSRVMATLVDDLLGGGRPNGNHGVQTTSRREGIFKVLSLLIMLSAGAAFGAVVSLHLMGLFRDGILSSVTAMSSSFPPKQYIIHADTVRTDPPAEEHHSNITAAAVLSCSCSPPPQQQMNLPAVNHETIHEFPDQNSNLHHNMSDDELLWRASLAPRRPGTPIARTPKVAFMFLTVGPLPLAPLWEKFFLGHQELYNIYVHASPNYTESSSSSSSSVFFGRHIPSQKTTWGDITIVDAERRLLANALRDFNNERFVMLSEACAPLWNFTFTYNYLVNSQQSFVGTFDDPGVYGRGRYNQSLEPEVKLEQWQKGAQWFEVQRELAIYIISDTKYYPKFRDFCQPDCYVDEHYIPTMMWIEFANVTAGRSVTSVDWSNWSAHPVTFVKKDAEEYFERARNNKNCKYNGVDGHVCYLFARKFAPDSLEPLLQRSASWRRRLMRL